MAMRVLPTAAAMDRGSWYFGGHGRPRVGVVRGFEKKAAVGTTDTCGYIRGDHELVMSRIQHETFGADLSCPEGWGMGSDMLNSVSC